MKFEIVSRVGAIMLLSLLTISKAYASFQNGNTFYQECQPSSDYINSAICMGYVEGVTDTFIVLTAVQKKKIVCMSSDVSARQSFDIVLKYLADHPETRNMEAEVIVMMALKNAFPCHK